MIRAILTIDDFPSKNTPVLVDYLNEKGIQAVFFAVGQDLERYEQQAVYALQHGMAVGNHSFSHPHFSELSLKESIAEIERCERALDGLYQKAGVARRFRPFRFPYGDKGGENRAAIQQYLKEHGFDKVKDAQIPWPWWKEYGLNQDADTFWTFDFQECLIRPGSGFTMENVWERMHDGSPKSGAALFAENGWHILLMHAHDETESSVPAYYRLLIDRALENGVTFEKPEFVPA
ncbi:MAG: polysaccharide deacetylase family protein [Clostridia bacterium]|nr:polysaccharide deacetylase family protein [Clostridia bacterium]